MSIPEILYKLILGPLELLFDTVFSQVYQETTNAGFSIIALSLIINLLILPLYKRADAIQEEERDQIARMKPGIDKIKRVFKGDEQYLILKTYYRQNHYKPLYALRSALPLLLQVPFFMAAYNYLSNLTMLQGISFGPIPDLGRPDGMLQIGSWTINVLPVTMTLINIISGAIYTQGMPLKSKIQLYGMALLFLVLLYDSPSGLVFYWTLNNVFSLGKNVIQKAPDPRRLGRILWAVTGAAFLVFFEVIHPVPGVRMKAIFAIAGLMMMLPLIRSFLPQKRKAPTDEKTTGRIFFAACLFLAILTGLLIPSAVINDSPSEFVDLYHFQPPANYLLDPAMMAVGLFLIWGGIFYRLSSPGTKRGFSLGFACSAAAAMLTYNLFNLGYGSLSPIMQYEYSIKVWLKDMLLNGGVILLGCMVIFLLWKKWQDFLKIVLYAGCAAVLCMSIINISGIVRATPGIQKSSERKVSQEAPSFTLDKQGKNVVFIMMDRAISGFIPYIFNEKPEIASQFEGFTYYPNTLSYGPYTNTGTPALFGGYEYTPFEINKRDDVTLKQKQNEALELMPRIFADNGYGVTVCDAPYANYVYESDLSIFDKYPGIRTYHTMGAMSSVAEQDPIRKQNRERLIRRNLFCYSIFRCTPVFLNFETYDHGQYNDAAAKWGDKAIAYVAVDEKHSYGIKDTFLDSYSVMENFSSLVNISDDGSDHFMMLNNETTHEIQLLQLPDYVPQSEVDNRGLETGIRTSPGKKDLKLEALEPMEHYYSNMSAFIWLGRWLDYLRENDLYDNTRIIIASDHGRSIELYYLIMDGIEDIREPEDFHRQDVMYYNPLLMVKDFGNSTFTTSDTFMTNADVPSIAFSGLIEKPVNPATGKEVTTEMKNNNEQYVMYLDWKLAPTNETTFKDYTRITMRNHYMFDPANWSYEK